MLRRVNRYEVVTDYLKRLKPGRLISTTALMKELGISDSRLRQLLRERDDLNQYVVKGGRYFLWGNKETVRKANRWRGY